MGRIQDVLTASAGAATWSTVLAVLVAAAVLAALGALVAFRRKPLAALLVCVLLALVAVGGVATRHWIWTEVGQERMRVLEAMAARPGDPWPRSAGHAPLGMVGAQPSDKGYVEPGGGFSPSVGSFGVSFWVLSPDGRRITSSDDLPLGETSQTYQRGAAPGVIVRTAPYTATWRVNTVGGAQLDLASHAGADHVEIVLRGVGPAGGPLNEIRRLGRNELLLNGRWRVRTSGPLDLSFSGVERGDWTAPRTGSPGEARDRHGWSAARIRVPVNRMVHMEILDSARTTAPAEGGPSASGDQGPGLPGVDPRFDASVEAQIASLEQSMMGDEIAPGDPVNYPLPWLRDGAYVLVAMARAGQVQRMRALAVPFARRDYFGGFGAEADAPGLALWALGEASTALHDPAFDRSLWPHVVRKVRLIEELQSAQDRVQADYSGRVVPRYRGHPELRLVAEPARDGLIQGRMDWQRPVFYVNAVSYAGLRSASALAARLGHDQEAAMWLASAKRLRTSYQDAFAMPAYAAARRNERTAISGLWPGEIADPQAYGPLLEERWAQTHVGADDQPRSRPLWPYFTLAEAHQWLRLGRPDRVWSTLDWFWAHQPAPGLYSLWEGRGREDAFGLWRQTRGWVRPAGVTPHYWAAAEMLLLQLAMLAEVQGPPGEGVLVIGAGVPAEWLKKPFVVSRVGTAAGPVTWEWDGASVRVQVPGPMPVRLGPAFPAGTPVSVRLKSQN